MSSQSSQNSWKDIPPEIIDEILGYCDELSLLVLSQVNHQLNSLALSRYFAPQITGDVIHLHSKCSALRYAFWLPGTIRHIDCCLAPNLVYDPYLKDLRDLTVFIRRMPKLTSLYIDSGNTGFASLTRKKSYCDIWTKFFVVAISKGCEILEVRERGTTKYRHFFLPPRPSEASRPSILQSISQIFHSFGQALAPKRAVTVTARDPSPLLSESPLTTGTRTIQPFQRKVQIDGICLSHLPSVFRAILMHHTASVTHLSLANMDH